MKTKRHTCPKCGNDSGDFLVTSNKIMLKCAGCAHEWVDGVKAADFLNNQAESKAEKSALDVQEGGNHYKNMKIQPIEFITANNIGFCEGNVIKYVCRHEHKNGLEDLKKAKHYIDLLIETKYGGNNGEK